MPFRLLLALVVAAVWLASPAHAQPDRTVVTTPQVRAELLAHAPDGVEPGKPVWLGLSLTHQPDWHTYWKNSGDSGLPTTLAWELPPGVTAGDIAWPVPRKIPIGNLANYGYEGKVLLPVPLTLGPDFRPDASGRLTVKLRADWLVCRKECIPEEGEFTLSLPLQSATALNGPAFESALAAHPKDLPAGSTVDITGSAIAVRVAGLPAAWQGQTLAFYPETAEVIETAGAWTQAWDGGTWTARVPLSAQRSQSPQPMPVVLALEEGGEARVAWRAQARVNGDWPQVNAPAAVSPQLQAALDANTARNTPATLGLAAALLGALLGGLVLNLMPCVFPVLAIKALGFARHAEARSGSPQAAARTLRTDTLAYCAGVLLSFLALGGLLLGLRAAGEQLGWGFQLQSPAVVAALAALFTLIGLNLAGLFEFGHVLPSGVAALQSRQPTLDAFLSGVLAVAIASPCTAPFMGASMGLAIGLPAAQALLVFGAVGLGMALPFLAIGLAPGLLRWLPRPGPWMDLFRRCMAFPMFATVAWLVWVLGQQTGIDGAGALLALLVALAAVAWALGLAGRARLVMGTLSVALAAVLLGLLGPAVLRPLPAASGAALADGPWQPWAPGRVEQILAGGKPVMVDFTAAWCVTCQYNKKTALAHPDVLADLSARQVQLLRADWTRRDPAITEALRGLGRSGVPVYVIYQPGAAPVLLSELPSVEEIRAAVARL